MLKKSIFLLLTVLVLSACSVQNIEAPEITEEQKMIMGTVGEACQTNEDCRTPADYLIQSNCPFGSICMENKCVVTCPLIVECQTDSDCNCSDRGDKTIECLCIENSCVSVEDK